MSDLFTVDQVTELRNLEKLRLKRQGVGLRGELQNLIDRLSSEGFGRKNDDMRVSQAKVFWDAGLGIIIGFASFEAYLETIPPIPTWPDGWLTRFELVVLVDKRLKLHDFLDVCGIDGDAKVRKTSKRRSERLGEYKDGDFYWIRCQKGDCFRSLTGFSSLARFGEDEVGLDIYETVSMVLQRPGTFQGYPAYGGSLAVLGDSHTYNSTSCFEISSSRTGDLRLCEASYKDNFGQGMPSRGIPT